MNRRRFLRYASLAAIGAALAPTDALARRKPKPPHPNRTPTPQPSPTLTPSPLPTPSGARPVQPGEDIGALLASWDDLELQPGSHRFFAVPADGRDRRVAWTDGAVVEGGVLIPAGARAALIAPEITSAVFGIIWRGFAAIHAPNIHGNSEGIRVEGSQARGTVVGGSIHDNSKPVRNTQFTAHDDYSAQGIGFRNTVGPILVDGVSVYNQRVFGPRPTTSWDDDNAGLGIRIRPQVQSWDYGLNDGSAFELWQAAGVTIQNCRLTNNMCAVETGTHGPDCTFAFRHNLVVNGNSDPAQLSQGMLLRAARNSVVEHNTFVNPDHWAMTIEGGGNFGATVDGLIVRSNLAVTPSALFETNGQVAGSWTHSHNGVAGTRDWGAFGASPNGVAAADPLFTSDYRLQPGSPFIGKAHDGGNIGAY